MPQSILPSPMRSLIPLGIVAAGVAATALLFTGRPAADTVTTPPLPPAVRFVMPTLSTLTLSVSSQGSVEPRTETELVAEVSGRIVSNTAAREDGAFFQKGDVLAELDTFDFEIAEANARAALERADAERDFASAVLRRRSSLAGEGVSSPSLFDEAKRAARVAEARLLEAQAQLRSAERDLARTRIVAPYDGRMRSKRVDVGQYVSVGTPIAQVYAVDYAEIRLALPDSELPKIDLSLADDAPEGVEVLLRATFAGGVHEWRGSIVRTEAEIDQRTRMVHVVARIASPYASTGDGRPPLAAGLFVEAEILGRQIQNAVRVPRAALVDDTHVWIVDGRNQLRSRRVKVLRFASDDVWLDSEGLAGERVALTQPNGIREGLAVRPVSTDVLVQRGVDRKPKT